MNQRVALITGASQGLGLALAEALAGDGWALVIDARRADRLEPVASALAERTTVVSIPGDVTDPSHRAQLVEAVQELGRLDLLVNNASTLGESPLPTLADIDLDVLRRVYEVNVVAPLALTQDLLGVLDASAATIVNVTSDAAVEAYERLGRLRLVEGGARAVVGGAGGRAADVRVLVVDPGDMRTEMHQDAFPGEDISDRPLPAAVVPGLVALINGDHPSGRVRAAEVGS